MTAAPPWNPLVAQRALGWLGRAVGAPARLVASRLISHADREGRSHPSIARLAYETGLSDRTVQRALAQLRAAGIVTWLSAFDPSTGRHGANRYRVSMAALAAIEATEKGRQSPGGCQPDAGGGDVAAGGGVGVADDQLRDLPTTKEAEARGRAGAHVPLPPAPANDAAAADVDALKSDDLSATAAPTNPPAPSAEPATPPQRGIALGAVVAAWRAAHGARYGRTPPHAGLNDEALLLELLGRAGDELARAGLGRGDPGAAARVIGRVLRAYVREDGSRETYREGFLVAKRHALGFLRGERKLDDFFAAALRAEERAARSAQRAHTRSELTTEAFASRDLWREALDHIHAAASGPPVPRLRRASGAQ
jgi:hypothetical protein